MLLENTKQVSSFKKFIGLCLACNDAHEQTTCLVYQYQEYLSRSNGIPPPSVADDISQNVNMMNFTSVDIGVFTIETRFVKRLHVSCLSNKKVEPPKNHDQIAPKKLDATSSSTNKAPLK